MIKILMRSFFALILFCPIVVRSQDRGDIQFWNETVVTIPLMKSKNEEGNQFDRLTLQIIGNFRIGKNSIQGGDKRIGVGLEYRLNRFITLQPSYIYRAEDSSRRPTQYESRIRMAINLQKDWSAVRLRNRNMVDFRQRKARVEDPPFYRNRVQVIFPQKRFDPYLMNEVYYQVDSRRIARNRMFIGLNRRINKTLTTDTFYVWQHNRTGNIRTVHGFGVNLRIRIG